jgi:octaprenyl-diphosphate synthase
MAIGAASVTKDDEIVEKMFQIGLNVGIAFQIKDDIFDYQSKGLLGKPTGNDIKEKKITLPLLYILNNCKSGERSRILQLIKRKNKNQAKVKELVDLVVSRGGLEYAATQMNEFREKAIAGIMEFPESDARTSLIELVDYSTTRKK